MRHAARYSSRFLAPIWICFFAPVAQAQSTVTIGAIGDSISTALDARYAGNNLQFSWSTGNSNLVDSHYLRLKRTLPGYTVRAYNEAVPGSTSADLPAQVEAILRRPIDYLTITIGANDICEDKLSLAETVNNLRNNLIVLTQARPRLKIMLLAVPDAYRLVKQLHLGGSRYCQAIWTNPIHPICKPLLAKGRSDGELLLFRDRWVALNRAFREISAEFPHHLRFAAVIAERGFALADVSSVDCFHPSVAGQRRLAESTWGYW